MPQSVWGETASGQNSQLWVGAVAVIASIHRIGFFRQCPISETLSGGGRATYLHENFSICTAAVEGAVSASKSIDITCGEAGMLFDSANE